MAGNMEIERLPDLQCEAVKRRFYDVLCNDQFFAAEVQRLVYLEETVLKLHLQVIRDISDLYDAVTSEYLRFAPFLDRAVKEFVQSLYPDFARDRSFHAAFYGQPFITSLRDLKAENVGKLLCIEGTVTKTTEVRPELVVGSFRCLACGTEVGGVKQQFKYSTPKICVSAHCGNRTNWELVMEKSEFTDWQKLRLQEHSSSIPAGSMPRSIDIILRHDLVDTAKPGERVLISGTLVVVPDVVSLIKPGDRSQVSNKLEGRRTNEHSMDSITGLRELGVRELSYKFSFIACHVQTAEGHGWNPEVDFEPSETEKRKFLQMKEEPHLYSRLARCIAPSVLGHDEVKRGLLLMLMGGVHKTTSEGLKLRGDINICIVGDPSTAKSQFLKFICGFMPRAVYTSGRSSTAAGLTAAVQRDPETGDFCIEAGALILANNSICCIDEFDKMESKDQVAIHEAMEQQTITLAKAGIQATLNASCSVLAAANPIFGRYDKSKKLKENIDISPPLLSRFDLFFVVVDECDEAVDNSIAKHIVKLHQKGDEALVHEFSIDEFQLYLRIARSLKPQFTPEAAEVLRAHYKLLRQGDNSDGSAYRLTVRQLESMIRLSEAYARVNYDPLIRVPYVEEAVRLLKKSIIHVETSDVALDGPDEASIFDHRKAQAQMELEKMDEEAQERAPKEKMSIKFEEYQNIAKCFVLYLRDKESLPEYEFGVSQHELAEWFVEQRLSTVRVQADAEHLYRMANSIIERLISKDRILLVINDSADPNQRTIQAHSNFVVD
jgi:DNA replication licensing factor MCM6